MQKYCTKCGGKIESGYKFCYECGAPTLEESQLGDEPLYLDNHRKGLLSLFLKPRQLDREGWQMMWSESLGVEYVTVITQFIKNGYLEKASVEDKLMTNMRIKDLKPLLRELGLKVTGKKSELVQRLIINRPEEAQKLADDIKLYVCTLKGTECARQWKDEVETRRVQIEEAVWNFLQRKKFKEAWRLIEDFRAFLPPPMLGGGIGRSTSSCDSYFKHRVDGVRAVRYVEGMPYEEVEQAKIEAINAIA